MPTALVPVEWELAADRAFRRILRRGETYATPQWAHSVHVEPTGLEPASEYWYRFTSGAARSPVGRTRTAAVPGSPQARLRIAVANCQQYEQGWFCAYRHMLGDELDLIVHVGDYIYESSWGHDLVRQHGAPTCFTLDDYRTRHALYRADPDLQAAHAHCPWLLVWDDHDVANDYAGDMSEYDDEPRLFLARRAAAYQAWYEHMPLPRQCVPFGPDMRLYMERSFGDLARICMLDQRQYRSPEACPEPGHTGGHHARNCPGIADPTRTMLGARQESWLRGRLGSTQARWNILAEGTLMAYANEVPAPDHQFWTDAWSGYPAARDRLIATLSEAQVPNPVVLSGDIHAFVVSRLNQRADDPESAPVAVEFTASSITSEPPPETMLQQVARLNPHVQLATGRYRGYPLLDFTPERLQVELFRMDDVKRRDSGRSLLARFVVVAGRPVPIRDA